MLVRCWRFAGGCRRVAGGLLADAGECRRVLVSAGGCWRMLVSAGGCW